MKISASSSQLVHVEVLPNKEVVEMPDATLYPSLRGCSLSQLQLRMAMICTLNQRLATLLQNTEMNLGDQWWSLAFKLRQVRCAIFTSIKLDFLRVINPDESGRFPDAFRVTVDRRLAQDSSKNTSSSLTMIFLTFS